MKSYRLIARLVGAAAVLLMSFLTFSPITSAQSRPPEPVVPPPNMTGEVQPLTPEEIAAIPAFTGEQREESGLIEMPSATPPQPFDLDARLALHTRGGTRAATFVVNYFGDSLTNDAAPGDGICADNFGTCGLRTAIQEANALPGLDTIILPPGVITLATAGADENAALTGDLDITDSLIIQGAGASRTFINGNGAATGDRVFHVLNLVDIYTTVDFIDLSVYGGSTTSFFGGGGILASCPTDVVVLRSNIFDNFGALGGGLTVDASGNCRVGFVTRLTVYESAVFRNTANASAAAGIESFNGGTLNLINSTVALNVNSSSSTTATGGIKISTNTLTTATIRSSTIIDNSAPNATSHDGVGLFIGTGSTTTLTDNIVAFNTFNSGSATSNCGGSGPNVTTWGGNIYSSGTVTCPTNDNDSTGNNFFLVNGIAFNTPGQTPTGALSSSSAARFFGKSCVLSQDQRGVARPVRACSSGAFQFVNTTGTAPGEFSLLSPAITTNNLVQLMTWQTPTGNASSYTVIVRNAAGIEILRLGALTPASDADRLTCSSGTGTGNVNQSICTLTLSRAQTRRFQPNQTYEWEVRAQNANGSSRANTTFVVGLTINQFLSNPSFEFDTDVNGVPDSWVAKRRRLDGLDCSGSFANSGTCAYTLVGESPKNSLLRQTITFTIPRDSMLVLGGFVRGNGAINGMSITLNITYADGSVQSKVVNLGRTTGYQPLSFFDPNLLVRVARNGATSVTVVINNRSAGGRAYIDDLSLSVLLPAPTP
ncbi:MAG: hypothetical protein MUF38_09075 [Anaerolineae bacterium]|nr:hypothetical protein [Anaerolineae bacterium]